MFRSTRGVGFAIFSSDRLRSGVVVLVAACVLLLAFPVLADGDAKSSKGKAKKEQELFKFEAMKPGYRCVEKLVHRATVVTAIGTRKDHVREQDTLTIKRTVERVATKVDSESKPTEGQIVFKKLSGTDYDAYQRQKYDVENVGKKVQIYAHTGYANDHVRALVRPEWTTLTYGMTLPKFLEGKKLRLNRTIKIPNRHLGRSLGETVGNGEWDRVSLKPRKFVDVDGEACVKCQITLKGYVGLKGGKVAAQGKSTLKGDLFLSRESGWPVKLELSGDMKLAFGVDGFGVGARGKNEIEIEWKHTQGNDEDEDEEDDEDDEDEDE